MTKAFAAPSCFVVVALVVASFSPLAVQAQNTNTTIQEGRVNINRTIQIGDSNENATYQNGKININRTIQLDGNSRYGPGRLGRVGYRASRAGGYKRAGMKRHAPGHGRIKRHHAKRHHAKRGKGKPGRRGKGHD